MTVFAIAQGRVTDAEAMNNYLALAGPTLEAHQVKLLALDENPENVEGEVEYPRTVILEFTNEAAFYRWYNSDEYQAARKHRLDATKGTFILVKSG